MTLSDAHPQEEEEEEEEECEERPGARSHGAVCVRDPETDEVREESCDHDDHDRLVSCDVIMMIMIDWCHVM